MVNIVTILLNTFIYCRFKKIMLISKYQIGTQNNLVVFSTISLLYFYYSPVTGVLITLTTASQQHITSVHERSTSDLVKKHVVTTFDWDDGFSI